MIEKLRRQFANPPKEFSPVPFWFWNDELSKEEIVRQIHDFHEKEVDGFVIHPRMGLPRSMPYLSDSYMELVETAVAEAACFGMSVILYDEGMYPSGSACGLVVKSNPEFASRGLRMEEHVCGRGATRIPVSLVPGESVVSAQAVCKISEHEIAPGQIIQLEHGSDYVEFTPPDDGVWSVLLFVDTYSKGTIRGVHPGQDDGEPDAPAAADLLNPEAIQTFIQLTHERYYDRLKSYFGSTIFAFFTDEPDLLGRGHRKGLKPWTKGFMTELLQGGVREEDLPALWFEAGGDTRAIRARFDRAVRSRLARTYYKPLADWCEAHGIGLTGHPAASDDIGLLEHFHIPGQDVVWRFIAPEDGKSLTGAHSTLGKCSSDAARHRGRRRNLNECFGVCGKESGWSLTADNMKWYLDWLFVRGVNLISPHAFYYSIRGERRDERPPDVGPNNIWWPEYSQFSRYIKRMSWMMTDSVNGAEVAVLAQAAYLPWKIAKPLYEGQIEFNYLEEELINGGSCGIQDGVIRIAEQRYRAVLVEDGGRVSPECWQALEQFSRQGGLVVELCEDSGSPTPEIGQHRIRGEEEIPAFLADKLGMAPLLQPAAESIRISRVTKEGVTFYVMVNEGETRYEGSLLTKPDGHTELWRPWTGSVEEPRSIRVADGQSVSISLERRECLILAVDPVNESELSLLDSVPHGAEAVTNTMDISKGWSLAEAPAALTIQTELQRLASWTEWEGMEHFSGTIDYRRVLHLELNEPSENSGFVLDCGEAHELVRVWVNGKEAGARMWKPYVFDIGDYLQNGVNELQVAVTNSLANRYDGQTRPSGLIGPVTLSAPRQ